MTKNKKAQCIATAKGRIPCSKRIRRVALKNEESGSKNSREISRKEKNHLQIAGQKIYAGQITSGIPGNINLCDRHHQELKERGILGFFKFYGVNDSRGMGDELPDDRHMTYLDPGVLEGVSNARKGLEAGGGYGSVPGFEDLKQVHIDLAEMPLTDKQLVAVCLVFYGGIKKKTAARAMKISAQALSDHIKAALKKIKWELCNS